MSIQATNFLLKQAKKAVKGKSKEKFTEGFDYLGQVNHLKNKKCQATNSAHFLNLNLIEEALKVNLAYKLDFVLQKKFEATTISSKDFTNFHYGQDLVELSNLHIKFIAFWNFKDRVNRGDIKCQNLQKNLANLCMLYGLSLLADNSKYCYQCGYF